MKKQYLVFIVLIALLVGMLIGSMIDRCPKCDPEYICISENWMFTCEDGVIVLNSYDELML